MDYWQDGFWKGLTYWVWDLQSLVAGLLALLAAIITSWFLWRQIRQTRKFRIEDENRQLKSDVMVFTSQYGELVNGVLNFYKRLKSQIPEGYTGDLWAVMPHLFELDEKHLRFSNQFAYLFMGKSGGALLSELLLLQTSRNRLAETKRHWNNLNRQSELIFSDSSRVHEETGRIVTTIDPENTEHRSFLLKAESLLESMIFAAEEQVRDIIKLQPKLQEFLGKRIKDSDYKGYVVKEDYIEWFKENSSCE